MHWFSDRSDFRQCWYSKLLASASRQVACAVHRSPQFWSRRLNLTPRLVAVRKIRFRDMWDLILSVQMRSPPSVPPLENAFGVRQTHCILMRYWHRIVSLHSGLIYLDQLRTRCYDRSCASGTQFLQLTSDTIYTAVSIRVCWISLLPATLCSHNFAHNQSFLSNLQFAHTARDFRPLFFTLFRLVCVLFTLHEFFILWCALITYEECCGL